MRSAPFQTVVLLLAVTQTVRGEEVDFGRAVRPILSRNCFKCHGPDDGARKAGLRLDVRDQIRQMQRERLGIERIVNDVTVLGGLGVFLPFQN